MKRREFITLVGTAALAWPGDGTVLSFRLTFAIVKVDGQWLIAQHHGLPVPK